MFRTLYMTTMTTYLRCLIYIHEQEGNNYTENESRSGGVMDDGHRQMWYVYLRMVEVGKEIFDHTSLLQNYFTSCVGSMHMWHF